MALEIERKFILNKLPKEVQDVEPLVLWQGYLAISKENNEVRIRNQNGRFTLTVKGPGSLSRTEHEIELTEAQFEQLKPACIGYLEKQRYQLQLDHYAIEIDQYLHPLTGLLIAEIEFKSEAEAHEFQPFDWMDREVTELNFLKNRNLLSIGSYEELKEVLNKYPI